MLIQRFFILTTLFTSCAVADDHVLHSFQCQQLTDVYFSEGANAADVNGDGVTDVVYGPYWFRFMRGKEGVDWFPYKADGEAGIGRQVSIVAVNNDKLPDIVVGGMLGTHVLTQQRRTVGGNEFSAAQPKVYFGPKLPKIDNANALRGQVITTGVLSFPGNAVEGNSHTLNVQIAGASRKVKKAYMFALDYLRIKKPDSTFVAGKKVQPKPVASSAPGFKAKSRDGRQPK